MSSCEWVVALPLGRRGRHRRGDDAGVYTNRWKWPLGSVSGRLCTLLRLARIVRTAVGTQECTQIDGNGLSAPFRGICVHCCDASRDTNRDASCLCQVARAPQPPRRAGGAPSLAPPAWSGRQALREWRRCQAGIFAEASTHTNPRRASLLVLLRDLGVGVGDAHLSECLQNSG